MATPPVKVEITGEAKGLFEALEKSTGALKGFARDVEAHTSGLGKIADNIKAPFVALVGVLGGAAFLKSTVDETKNWTVESIKLSKTLGITTEQASVLNVAIGDIFGNMDEFLPVVAKLTKTLNADEEAFTRLGVATRTSTGQLRPTVEIMQDVNTKLAGMKSGTDRNIESARIYGRGWLEVQRYLGLTAEVMQQAQEKAEKLNLIVGPDAVAKVKAYRDSVNDLEDTVKGLKIRIGTELMPALTTFNQDLAKNGPEAVASLSKALSGLYQMVNAVRETFRQAFETTLYQMESVNNKAIGLWGASQAALSGNLTKAKEILKATAKDQEEMLRTHLLTMKAIEDDYTDAAVNLMGLGPKPKNVVGGGTGNAGAGKHEPAKENLFLQELSKLTQDRLKFRLQETLAQKEALDLDRIEVDLAKELDRLEKERVAGQLTDQQFLVLATQAKEDAEQARLDIQKKYAGLRASEQAKVDAIELEAAKRHEEAIWKLEDEKLQHLYDMNMISGAQMLEAERATEERRYQATRERIEQALQDQRLSLEERARLNSDMERLEDQHNQRMQQLQQKAQQIQEQTTARGGIKSYIRESQQALQQWGTMAKGVMQGVENSFAQGISGILSGNMTLGQGLKAIWKGIADTIIQSLAQIAAKYLVTAAAEAIFGKEQAATSMGMASAHEAVAAAGFFEAYAWMPFVGMGLALGNIAVMEGVMAAMKAKALVGAAEGGWFGSPTLAVIGEGSRPELVVPDTSFKSFAADLTASVLYQERQASGYLSQAAGYSRNAGSWGGSGVDLRGATIFTSSSSEMQDFLARAQRGYDRRKN